MDAEQASLSTIIIDANGNPIGQVIYRCALCRKICDSSSDAMLHYQLDHIELSKLQLQHQPVASTATINLNARSNYTQQQQQQQQQQQNRSFNSSPSTSSTNSNSLLKRTNSNSPSSNSLLKRTANTSTPSSSASNSLLKRASNVMRCYQQQSTSSSSGNTRQASNRRLTNDSSGSNNPNTSASGKIDTTIHRQYTTTSASRAAKRYTNTAQSNVSGRNNVDSGSNTANTSSSKNSSTHSETNNSFETPQNATTSSLRSARGATPRHVQRTNQYTANLKAKINAQKSASSNTNATYMSNDSDAPIYTSQKTPTPVTLLSQQSNASTPSTGGGSQLLSGSVSSGMSNNTDVGDNSSSTTMSSMNTNLASTPSDQKDSMKTYSLRPRSSSRRSARIFETKTRA